MADLSRQLTLRLPQALYEQLAALAKADMRSVNAEVIVLLREALAQRERTARDA